MVDMINLKKYTKDLSLLYVEDDEILREKTADLLSCIFNDISLASDGEIGLDKYKKKKHDIVITDINMPNMNGIEMIENIKNINQEQIIVVTSAHDDSEYLRSLIKLGIENFVLKPIDLEQLVALIQRLSKRLYDSKNFAKNNELLSQQSQFVAMGEMAGMIAHQWRQPLTSVSLRLYNLKLLAELGSLNDDETVTTIEECTNILSYLSETLDTFRDFVKIDDERSNFSVDKVIKDTIELIHQDLEDCKIEINIKGDKDIVIYGIVGKFAQIILNIINNAKDEFKLRKNNDNAYINIDIKDSGDFVNINISDNAGGIENNIIEKIFDPYFSTKSKNKSGLGLHTTKNIVELNFFGEIIAENAYENDICEGASFKIKLRKQ
jgi:C4-dicarboxylate-specific signal transduction histidine kinase